MKSLAKALICGALATACVLVAPSQQTQAYVPTETKVAILPVLNASGEKWEELRTRQTTAATDFLNKEFSARGFEVVSADAVKAAMQSVNLDMADEENWRRDSLYKIGEAAGARLVLMVVITGRPT